MRVVLIRHSKTAGNLKGRYIVESHRRATLRGGHPSAGGGKLSGGGACLCKPDEALPGDGESDPIRRLPSGRSRCSGSVDFGDFENKNYLELNGNPDYQAWVDGGGTLPFPGGESREAFQERCGRAF